MIRLYLAGASAEASLCASFMRRIRAAGIEITKDWTADVLATSSSDRDLGEHVRLRHATADVHGVTEADVTWAVLPSAATSKGMWFELGVAYAARRRVIVSGDWRQSIFTALAARKFDTHEEALAYLVSTYGRRPLPAPYSEMP